jgi:hypothetical protein
MVSARASFCWAVAYTKSYSYVDESGGLTALEFLRTETEKARITMKGIWFDNIFVLKFEIYHPG